MFKTVPTNIDTKGWESYYGKGTVVKVEHTTPFRSREATLIRETLMRHRTDPDYFPPFNIIGETNLKIVAEKLVISEHRLFNLNRTEFKGNDFFIDFWLHHSLNPKLFGYKKYGKDIYMRPIIVAKKGYICSAADINAIVGMQLLSRDNVEHNGFKPIIVKGIRYEKDFKVANGTR